MSDAAACPIPHLTGDAARWLLAVTGNMTVRLDNPHATQTVMMSAAVRGELEAIAAAAAQHDGDAAVDGGEPEIPPEDPGDE